MTGGTVAAMIAHEVKQPLSAMIMRSDTGFRSLDRAAPEILKAKEQFKRIAADGHRTAAVIESIRTNFKMDAGRKTSVDANDLIAETLNLIRDDLRHYRVVVKAEPSARRPKILGDRIQLQQVLLNLMTNAIDAMKAIDGPRVLQLACDVHDDRGVSVSVADTGTRDRAARCRADLRPAVHDEVGRHGDGIVDLPFHYGRPRRTDIGWPEQACGNHLRAQFAR